MKPDDTPIVNRRLRKAFERKDAPIHDLIAVHVSKPFRVLISTILSARTKDEMTAQVSRRLFKRVKNADDLRGLTLKQIEDLIFPIGFFRTKARHLKALPDVLDAEFGGRIPDTIDELCRLPGVGRKTANLVVAVAFDKPAICVDVHVHRICNRLALVQTKTPAQTERTLRAALPKRYWKGWNRYLVSYGQTVCTPRNPNCSECCIRSFCERVGVDD